MARETVRLAQGSRGKGTTRMARLRSRMGHYRHCGQAISICRMATIQPSCANGAEFFNSLLVAERATTLCRPPARKSVAYAHPLEEATDEIALALLTMMRPNGPRDEHPSPDRGRPPSPNQSGRPFRAKAAIDSGRRQLSYGQSEWWSVVGDLAGEAPLLRLSGAHVMPVGR